MNSVEKNHPSNFKKVKWELTTLDRCDKCQSQALIKVSGLNGELLFCGHDYNEIMNDPEAYKKMMSFMISIIDEREKLTENKAIGSAN